MVVYCILTYWWGRVTTKFPKADYYRTYIFKITAPKMMAHSIMPRRALHSYNKDTDYDTDDTQTNSTNISRLKVCDTRFLYSTAVKRNISSLVALCFILVMLFGGWWLLSGLGTLNNKLPLPIEDSRRQSSRDISWDDIVKMQNLIDDLRKEIQNVKLDLEQTSNLVAQLHSETTRNNLQFTHHRNRLCRHSLLHMESYIRSVIKDPHYITPKDIFNWIHSTFVAKQDLDMRIGVLKSGYEAFLKSRERIIMDKLVIKLSEELNKHLDKMEIMKNNKNKFEALTDEYIKSIVQDAIALYDADKTGLVDYALESAGGVILSSRGTKHYRGHLALSIFGIPLWYSDQTIPPSIAIRPGTTPGECWSFLNFPGVLTIQLVVPIKVEAFSLEHISKLVAINGIIESAPKDFTVYGLRNESDIEPIQLGKYIYDYNGPPLQYFVSEVHGLTINIVELKIYSNHGHFNYTCLYRFRVHGIPVE